MKRKITAVTLILILALSSAFAAFAPTYDRVPNGIYSSPALIAKADEEVSFGFLTQMGSDIDGLKFMADPAGTLNKPAEYLASYLKGQDYSFWEANSQLISEFEKLDANFPDFENLHQDIFLRDVQTYFMENFLSAEYGDARRAYAIANTLPLIDAYPYESKTILGGDTYLGLKMYGGRVSNNFGWDWSVNIRFDGAQSLLDQFGSKLSIDARSNIGYAFDIRERFSLGFAIQPMLRIETRMTNQNYINARLSNDMLSLFSENFKFGTGLGLNLGASYIVNDELTLVLDFRNVPSFRSYYDLSLTDMADVNLNFQKDSNIYFMPPDIALSVLWNRGNYHLFVEISDIVSQLVWNDIEPERDFNFYGVPKVRFSYDVNEDLKINTKLGYEKLAFGVNYKGFEAEISTKLDKLAIGITMGYSF